MRNPPAFPLSPVQHEYGGGYTVQPGMTLRDWYAGQALIGLLSGQYRDTSRGNLSEVVVEAIKIAEAMLETRIGK